MQGPTCSQAEENPGSEQVAGSRWLGWKDDLKSGRGTFTWADGMKFHGNFLMGEHKDGVLTTKEGVTRDIP